MKRPLLALPLLLLAVSGCGSNDAAPAVDESDKPGSAIACLDYQGVPAHVNGKDENEVLLDAGPRVKFYLTAAAAEAAQFQGEGEGECEGEGGGRGREARWARDEGWGENEARRIAAAAAPGG